MYVTVTIDFHCYCFSAQHSFSPRFQLVDFGLAHLEYSRQKTTTGTKLANSITSTVHSKPAGKKSKGATSQASVTITPVAPYPQAATPRPTVNGLIPPHTYQRQVHQRIQAKAARESQGSASIRTRGSSSSTVQQAQALVGGAGGRNGVIAADDVWLCPVRHKVTEICDFCMGR